MSIATPAEGGVAALLARQDTVCLPLYQAIARFLKWPVGRTTATVAYEERIHTLPSIDNVRTTTVDLSGTESFSMVGFKEAVAVEMHDTTNYFRVVGCTAMLDVSAPVHLVFKWTDTRGKRGREMTKEEAKQRSASVNSRPLKARKIIRDKNIVAVVQNKMPSVQVKYHDAIRGMAEWLLEFQGQDTPENIRRKAYAMPNSRDCGVEITGLNYCDLTNISDFIARLKLQNVWESVRDEITPLSRMVSFRLVRKV